MVGHYALEVNVLEIPTVVESQFLSGRTGACKAAADSSRSLPRNRGYEIIREYEV